MSKKRSGRKTHIRQPVAAGENQQKSAIQVTVLLFIVAVYGFYLAQEINLAPIDLGRHLKNGELFFQNLSVPNTNLYSYTHPDYRFVNHHWASGVVFFLIERVAGFEGISLFFILLSLATLYLFFHVAAQYASFQVAAPISLIIIPVVISRYRIRPEVFTYFLSAVYLVVLWNYKHGKLSSRGLFLLPILEAVWINLHIYFFLGIILIGTFLFESLILFLINKDRAEKTRVMGLGVALVLSIAATLANPSGLTGALYPFNIMKEYELPVIENASVWSVSQSDVTFLPGIYFKINFALLCFSWLYVLIRNPKEFSIANLLLTLFFSAIGWWAIRNFALFAYFSLPVVAANFKGLKISSDALSWGKSGLRLVGVLVAISGALILVSPTYLLSGGRGPRGIGLDKETSRAADFFLREKIQGPIFNNYDVGSYLIYYLYPRHRVFVDNRPEAYPGSFFRDVYVPMQMDENRWAQISGTYGFNVIVFNHRDLSVGGQDFIVRRVEDPVWAPVYMDNDIIILLKRYGPNQATISKYELPTEKVLESP